VIIFNYDTNISSSAWNWPEKLI